MKSSALLRQVSDEWGRAVLMVTHDPRIAAYADRIVFLKDGTIIDETRLSGNGSASEARARCASKLRGVVRVRCSDEYSIHAGRALSERP